MECLYRLMEHPDALATALVRQMSAQVFALSPNDVHNESTLNISVLAEAGYDGRARARQ